MANNSTPSVRVPFLSVFFWLCIVWPCAVFAAWLPNSNDLSRQQVQSIIKPDHSDLKLRNATLNDLDAVVDVTVAAFGDSPGTKYLFPHRHQYPNLYRKCLRQGMEKLLRDGDRDRGILNVATLPSNEDPSIGAVVAIAAWQPEHIRIPTSLGITSSENADDDDCRNRPDVSYPRAMAFIREMEKATETYFDRPFGRRQLYLDSLGTHPDYQRRGAGSAHVRWGLDLAKEREYLAVTLLASDAGRPVYAHLGFETLANMTVQVEGEEESVTWTVMAYNVSAHLQSLA